MNWLIRGLFFVVVFILPGFGKCQSNQGDEPKFAAIPSSFISRLNQKLAALDKNIDKQTDKYLSQLEKRDRKIRRKLSHVDSNTVKQLFPDNGNLIYQQIESSKSIEISSEKKSERVDFNPYIDSLKTSLSYLEKNGQALGLNIKKNEVILAINNLSQLQSKFQSSDQIKFYLKQRREQFKDLLKNYVNNNSIKKALDNYNQTVYYYSAQIKEYKDAFNDPDKLVIKILGLMNKIPAFTEFFKNNSQLTNLFGLPGNYGSSVALEGLQTQSEVQQLVKGLVGGSGSSEMSSIESKISSAEQELSETKDKLDKIGGDNSDLPMPDFKPNSQKTHSLFKRIEIGGNIQTTKSSSYFPTTTDFGLSIGYKMTDNFTIGVGGSYNVEWGQNINHVHISSNGGSLRSFVDVKIKSNLFISGGYELNGQTAITSFNQLRLISYWTQSGLLGLSKIISLKGKFVKKTKVQLFWDYLSYYQIPQTQPIKFRVGYSF